MPDRRTAHDEPWWDRAAENTQLYQIVSVDGDTLRYEARTALGDLYDAFELVKPEDGPNRMVDQTPDSVQERRHGNTIGGKERTPLTPADAPAPPAPFP